MKKVIKNNILDIIQTMYDAHSYIGKAIDDNSPENADAVLADCQSTAIELGSVIERTEGGGLHTVKLLESYCEDLYNVSARAFSEYSGKKIRKLLDKSLSAFENSFRTEIKVKLEVVFMPYKASMWDSLESIWKAANDDPDCNAYVIPVPYYERKPDGAFGEMHYEGAELPEYVPITHYDAYDAELMQPDVIYIHNPYDYQNYVTSVDPRFYSSELKKHTECLVFVPYFIAGYFNEPENYGMTKLPGVINSDMIVLQSETLKQIYLSNGVKSKKIIVSGSPKTDAVLDRSFTDCPLSWELLKERKVCLVNSSISSFLEWDNFIPVLKSMMETLINDGRYSILWRPHPLLESTINSMRTGKKKEYDEFCDWFSKQRYCAKDTLSDPRYAIGFSDILLSDYSSLIFSYIPTEKPVAEIFNGKSPITDSTVFACDTRNIYYYNYLSRSADDMLRMINDILENDPLKEARMTSYRRSMANCDGTCGIRTHGLIKKHLLG
ncbi:MAG: CDP-glycerol glycerophosphotransferase family protein [Huintestinicola sp.]|uniref:CDP-glycerol glycerophosphotransferase family protein n=1 Tax=Huintestinicola sp. TaxID=2981661 RepID=UPI003EFC3FC8